MPRALMTLLAVCIVATDMHATPASTTGAPSGPALQTDDEEPTLARKKRRRRRRERTPPPPPPPPPEPRLAFVPLQVDGMQKNELDRLNTELRAQVAGTSGELMLDEAQTAELLESAQALGMNCDINTTPCAAELGKLLGIPRLVLGRAAGQGARVGVELRLVEVETGALTRQSRGLLSADETGAFGAGDLVAALFNLAASGARLVVSVTPVSAELRVDGLPTEGEGKLRTVEGLAPGPHVLDLSAEGYVAAQQEVSLDEALLTVEVALAPVPEIAVERELSPLEVALPWTVAGTGAALVVGGAVATVIGALPLARHDAAVRLVEDEDAAGAGFSDTAVRARAQATEAEREWNGYGGPSFFGGIGAVVVGAAALTGGTLWALWLQDRGPAGAVIEPEAASE